MQTKTKNTTLEAFNFGLSVLPGRAPGKTRLLPLFFQPLLHLFPSFYLKQPTWRATLQRSLVRLATAGSPKIPPSVIDTCAARLLKGCPSKDTPNVSLKC